MPKQKCLCGIPIALATTGASENKKGSLRAWVTKAKIPNAPDPQSTERWAKWDQLIFCAIACAENVLTLWLMSKRPANDVSKHTASLRDVQKLAVPILHVGWREESEWIEEVERKTMLGTQPSVSICCRIRVGASFTGWASSLKSAWLKIAFTANLQFL